MQIKPKTNIIVRLIISISMLFVISCANRADFDSNQIAGGIILGENVSAETDSDLANQIVLVTQNYDYNDGKPIFFGLCTGLLIGPRVVLTAAHCIGSDLSSMRILTAANPRDNLRKKKDVYTPINYIKHEGYLMSETLNEKVQKMTTDNEKTNLLAKNPDIALLYLDRNVKHKGYFNFSEFFNSNPIDTTATLISEVVITGYGKTTYKKNTADLNYEDINGILKKATLSVPTKTLTDSGYYIDQLKTAGICYGDSGGPVFIKENNKYRLISIAVNVFKLKDSDPSYTTCANYGLYINLEDYKMWLLKSKTDLERQAMLNPDIKN